MRIAILNIIFLLCFVSSVFAEDSIRQQRFNIHFQSTYINENKPAFHSSYSGTNSLSGSKESDNTITATLFAGIRLWKGAEVYINPEVAGGSGLSGAFGLSASTNGEAFRVGDPSPTLYLARGYFKQTIALSHSESSITDMANQLAGSIPNNYLQFYIGKVSLGDFFDNNIYANSPRTQFLNWTLMNNGAWDYAANLRGYTYSFVTVLQLKDMTYKACLATLPIVANGNDLNTDLGQEYSLNAEVDRSYKIKNKEGHVRLLGYYNNGDMGNYQQAIQESVSLDTPSVINTRKYGRDKYGFGVSADQQVSKSVGVFARLGWNDGQNETWCFTEADRSASLGISVTGDGWKRKDDNVGLAFVVNGLSKDHRDYLADGGLGFQLGDGKLNYGHESAAEFYYSFKPTVLDIWLSGDYQFILNPGYNKDRGPVNVFSIRVHVEL